MHRKYTPSLHSTSAINILSSRRPSVRIISEKKNEKNVYVGLSESGFTEHIFWIIYLQPIADSSRRSV